MCLILKSQQPSEVEAERLRLLLRVTQPVSDSKGTQVINLKVKPCTSHWDLNPCGWDSSPAKTQIGTRTHAAGTRTRPKPTVFQLRSHTRFQDLMELRFLMPHGRKNSVRDKVTGKKWIYLERNTLHRQRVGHLKR